MATATLAAGWDHICYLNRLMKRLDQFIARYIDLIHNPIITIKGLGAVITARFLAEIEVLRFPQEPLAQYMGLTWRKSSASGFVSENTRLTKVGNVYLHYYFILGANLLRQKTWSTKPPTTGASIKECRSISTNVPSS